MKRVLFLVNLPSPYRVSFFNELGKLCDLTVLFEGHTATDRDAAWTYEAIISFQYEFLKGFRTHTDRFICPGVIKYLKREWDAIVLGGYSSPTSIIAIEYLQVKNIPFFLEVDGGFIKNEKMLKYVFKRHLISSASGWLSTGDIITDYLVHYGAVRNKCYLYPFTSLYLEDILKADTIKSQDINRLKSMLDIHEKKVVLSVGQFIHRKGFDVLIKTMGQLGTDVGLYIVGGEAIDEFFNLVNKEVYQRIHFIGFKTKKELKKYYAIADVFAFPTRSDIWGLVINEAMSYHLPIVTTQMCVAGLELVKEGVNGHLVPVDDVDKLADAINDILRSDIKMQVYGEESRRIISNYTFENMAQRHMQIFSRGA